jgi:uncharacterized protein (TIGR00730 family)
MTVALSEQWQPTAPTENKPVISSVCVYCGSSSRVDDRYKENAAIIGQRLAKGGVSLVYGGGRVGLMGIVADSALQAGGKVIGIIPAHIQSKEIEHHGLTELHIVDSMHTRKRMMAEKSDAFVVLPGGFGTLDEAFEIITWKQLQLHEKPVIIFNDGGFWQPLIDLMEHMIEKGFANNKHRSLYTVAETMDDVFRLLNEPQVKPPPPETKWM